MSPSLRRRNPPPIDRGRKRDYENTEWNALLKRAMRSPGVWFEVDPPYDAPGTAAAAAHAIRSGRIQSLPEGDWDAVARDGVLFVMYLNAAS